MNTVIVETDDVVLISDMKKSQEVKNVVKKLEEDGLETDLISKMSNLLALILIIY